VTLLPLLAYLIVALVVARGLVRVLYRPGELAPWEAVLFVLPVAPFLPLPLVFAADCLAGVPISRATLVGAAVLLAVVLHVVPGATGRGAAGVPPAPPRWPDAPANARRSLLWLLLLSVVLFWCFAPLFGSDLFLYHLPWADELARTGHLPLDVTRSATDSAAAYPPLVYMAYAASWILTGVREHVTPRALAILFHIGLVVLVLRGLGGGERGLAAAWLLAASPPFVGFVHLVGTDFPMAFFAAGWALCVRGALRRPGDAGLAALHMALCLWTKYQALTLWAAGLLAVAVTPGITPAVRRRLLAGHAVAMLVFAPLLARNAITLGNPVYPALAELLGGRGLDAWTMQHLLDNARIDRGVAGRGALGLVLAGLNPALWLVAIGAACAAPTVGTRAERAPARSGSPSSAGERTGCEPASGGPAASGPGPPEAGAEAVADPEQVARRLWAAALAAYLLLWALLWVRPYARPERFLLPATVLAAALAGGTWHRLALAGREHRRAAFALAAGLLAFQAAYVELGLVRRSVPLQEPVTWPPGGARDAYRIGAALVRDGQPGLLALAVAAHACVAAPVTRRIMHVALAGPLTFQCLDKGRWLVQKVMRHGWVAHLKSDPDQTESAWMAEHVPQGAKTLTVGGLRDLLPRAVVPLESIHQRDLLEAPSGEELRRRMLERGLTHVFVDEVGGRAFELFRDGTVGRSLSRPDLFERLHHRPGRATVYRVKIP
jgi:hypothetical protein